MAQPGRGVLAALFAGQECAGAVYLVAVCLAVSAHPALHAASLEISNKIVNNRAVYDCGMASSEEKVTQHVAAFNVAVESGEWGRFTERFTAGAVMRFTNVPVGVPVGPFHGRDEIARGYAERPPDETMRVLGITSAGQTDTVRFAWAGGATGTMLLTWQDQLVSELTVTFDLGA